MYNEKFPLRIVYRESRLALDASKIVADKAVDSVSGISTLVGMKERQPLYSIARRVICFERPRADWPNTTTTFGYVQSTSK